MTSPIEQAAKAVGIELLVDNAPPANQRGAKYWRKFIAELQKRIDQLQTDLWHASLRATNAMEEEIKLRQQLAELEPTPFEMLVCRARQGREPLERTYRQLCLQLHPDQGGSAAAFRQLQADYEAVQHHVDALGRS
jgi:hypothetical protein